MKITKYNTIDARREVAVLTDLSRQQPEGMFRALHAASRAGIVVEIHPDRVQGKAEMLLIPGQSIRRRFDLPVLERGDGRQPPGAVGQAVTILVREIMVEMLERGAFL